MSPANPPGVQNAARVLLPLVTLAVCLVAAPAARAVDGAEVFANVCASCHGLDGKARTPAGKKLGAKDLSVSTLTDEAVQTQVRNGAKKNGVEKMPPFKDKLSPEEITAVAAFVKSFRK